MTGVTMKVVTTPPPATCSELFTIVSRTTIFSEHEMLTT